MKWCFVTLTYPTRHAREGAGLDTQQLARGLAELGHRVHVVCLDTQANIEHDAGVEVHFVRPRKIPVRRLVRLGAQLVPALKEMHCGWDLIDFSYGVWSGVRALHTAQRFDVIQCVDTGGLALCGVWPRRVSAPVIIRGHGFVDPALPGMQWCGAKFQHQLERFCLQRADAVLANSHYLRDTYCTQLGVQPARAGVLYSGSPLPVAAPTTIDVREINRWGRSDPIVVFAGRLEFLKGVDVLIEAMQHVRHGVPTARLVLLGELMPSFREQADRLLPAHADWLWQPGNVPTADLAAIVDQAQVLVLPSRKETFGRTLVEGQLHGLPVIGTTAGGASEIITDGETGYLVPPGEVAPLAEALHRVLRDEVAARQMGERARLSAQEKFGLPRLLQQQVEFGQQVMRR